MARALALVTAITLTLLLWASTVAADTCVGYSNWFGIDNTKAWASIPSWGSSPYSGGTLLRGQFHAHSSPDDWALYDYSGTGPASTLNKYLGREYDFLAVTDHNVVSPESVGWQGWAPNSCEITYSDAHVLAVGMSENTRFEELDYDTVQKVNDVVERINRVHARSGLAFVAHPDSIPYAVSCSELVEIVRRSAPNGVGIWTPWPSTATNSQNTWDRLVYAVGSPVWGYVEDDYHPDYLSHGKLGKTWLAVPGTAGEWWGTIKEKIRSGNYYCYYTTNGRWPVGVTPPAMHVSVSNSGSSPLISVTLDCPVDSIQFVGYKWGFFRKLKSPVPGSFDQYQATGHEKFVRVMAKYDFTGGTLWMTSQPIVINRSGNYSPYGSMAMQAMSSSEELILNYVGGDTKPLAPPAGYVGDVFDVTTSDGQLPPNPTLQLTYDGEDISALGGTQYLAIYWYDDAGAQWAKIGGTVDPVMATIEATITQLGKYCISADLPADTAAPQVWIDNPPYAASVLVDTTVKATVNDDLGAWRVQFYMNDHLLTEDTDWSDGWACDLRVADYCTGDWTLKAVAEDLAGNTGTAEMPVHIASSTLPPTVAFTSPSAGSLLSGIQAIAGTCSDDVAVADVALYADSTLIGYADLDGSGGWSAQVDTTYLADGVRTLKAVVEDYPGNQATATLPLGIDNGAVLSPIYSTRGTADGSTVRFDAIVVADGTMVPGGFYAEAANRSAAVKVISGDNINVGDAISLVGTVQAAGHEKTVLAGDVLVQSQGITLPAPLCVYGNLMLRAPDSIGKIVRIAGRRTVTDTANPARWFVIDDGSRAPITCRLADGVTFTTAKNLYTVTGVASVEDVAGVATPVVLVTSSTDITGF